MTRRRAALLALLGLVLLGGCTAPEPRGESASPAEPVATLTEGEQLLEAGTYRMEPAAVLASSSYPAFLVTVPDGWTARDGWVLGRGPVAVSIWNVDQIYGHPCQWDGTQSRPGQGVDDLVAALADVPMREPTPAEDVEIDGRAGKYFEWSVPADIAYDGEGFPDCDAKPGEPHDFVSWTGLGVPSTRYHQGPGQIDYVWVLDVDGSRLVIDAYSMPDATEQDVAEVYDIVESIRFIDE